MKNTRREFLGAAGVLAASSLLRAQETALLPTEDNIEGPYYRKDAPIRTQLAEGIKGEPLTISGRVLSTDGRSLGCLGAVVDVWHASAQGEYDNNGPKFLFRGRTGPGRSGVYRFETIMPGQYDLGEAKRPAHIHFKISASGHRTLTTQLYFKGDPWLSRDPFVRKSLIIELQKSAGSFDIVLEKL